MDDQLNPQEEYSADQIVRELRATFREEAYELLAELESALLELEKTPDDREQISRAFRAMHTIKGSGGACEFHEVVKFTHELETIFDKIRNGRAAVTQELIGLPLPPGTRSRRCSTTITSGAAWIMRRSGEILASLKAIVPEGPAPEKTAAAAPKAVAREERRARAVTYRIRFRPNPDIFIQGTNPVGLIDELRELGPCRVVAQTEAIPYLEEVDPQACYTYWDVILTTDQRQERHRRCIHFRQGRQ